MGNLAERLRSRLPNRGVVVVVLVAMVLVAAHGVLAWQLRAAGDVEAHRATEVAAIDDRLEALEDEAAELADDQEAATERRDAAEARQDELEGLEYEAWIELQETTASHEALQAELGVVAASLDEAVRQTETNHALIESLDECLDGATRAANALAVGDTRLGFRTIASVEDACARVGVVLGS